jgi:tetratricopeptide (TPR) repeat protein
MSVPRGDEERAHNGRLVLTLVAPFRSLDSLGEALRSSTLLVPVSGAGADAGQTELLVAWEPRGGVAVMQAFTDQEAMEAALHGPVACVVVDAVALLTAARNRPSRLVLNPAGPGGWALRHDDLIQLVDILDHPPATDLYPSQDSRPIMADLQTRRARALELLTGTPPIGEDGVDPERARETLADALAVFQELGDLQDAAMALTQLAMVDLWLGHAGLAKAELQAAMSAWHDLGNPAGITLVELSFAVSDLLSGDIDAAQRRLIDSLSPPPPAVRGRLAQLTAAPPPADRQRAALLLAEAGSSQASLGLPAAGLACMERALDMARALCDPSLVIDLLNRAGVVELQHGRPKAARRRLDEALILCRRHEDHQRTVLVLGNLGWAAFRDDDLERCAACFDECLSLSEALGDEARARAIVNWGWLHARRDELPAARDSVAAALNHAQDPRTRFAAAGLLLRLGRMERMGNDDTSARRSLTAAHEVFQALGDANGAAYAAAELEILGS